MTLGKIPFLEQHFVGHRRTVTSLCFSPNEKHLISSSRDNSFIAWNLISPSSSLRYKANDVEVSYVDYSPNGKLIAAAQGKNIRVWTSTIQGKSIEFVAHSMNVGSVKFSPDGQNILTASHDKSIKLWRTHKRQFVGTFIGHAHWVNHACFSKNGQFVLSCSEDKTIILWDPATRKVAHSFLELDPPRFVDSHPNGYYFGAAVGSSVKLYDVRNFRTVQMFNNHEAPVNQISFDPEGNFVLSGSDDNTSKIFDVCEGRPTVVVESHDGPITAVAFSPSGKHFATGSADKQVLLWNFDLTDTRPKPKTNDKPKFRSFIGAIDEVYSPADYEEKSVDDSTYQKKSALRNFELTDTRSQLKPKDTPKFRSVGAIDVYSPAVYEEKSVDHITNEKNITKSPLRDFDSTDTRPKPKPKEKPEFLSFDGAIDMYSPADYEEKSADHSVNKENTTKSCQREAPSERKLSPYDSLELGEKLLWLRKHIAELRTECDRIDKKVTEKRKTSRLS